MPVYAIDFSASTVRAFEVARDANAHATEAEDVVLTQSGLAETTAKTADFVALYNALTGKSISKFETRGAAVERTWKAIEAAEHAVIPATPEAPPPAPMDAAKPAKAPKAKKPAKDKPETDGKRGRSSMYAGMFFFPSAEVIAENPRREESLGYYSLEIIRKNPGISYEDFVAKGGRAKDAKWDADLGRVVVVAEKSAEPSVS